jgi:DNA (cytosine-5)-methyltransferase 1
MDIKLLDTHIETDKEMAEGLLQQCYDLANQAVETERDLPNAPLNEQQYNVVNRLGSTKHSARGVMLTLALYKALHPQQDIRIHKAEYEGGFSARGFDNMVTVPFLKAKGLPYSVESHWLTQTFSYAGPFLPETRLKTVPKSAGPDLTTTANIVEELGVDAAKTVVLALLVQMIRERNQGNIALTCPKNLSIDKVITLLRLHFNGKYHKNAPRLPQVAMYAIYQCLKKDVARYADLQLMPLERMKAANRKSGSVGDIDLNRDGHPIEAVETKLEIAINEAIVTEAMQKIATATVERYFILSTKPVAETDMERIEELKEDFLRSNGCEIIVNGIYDTIKYYLRLLKTTNDFINNYTALLATDEDLNYEHRTAWNHVCDQVTK